jgi:DNA-binding transcriptional LysR family regulator
VQPNSRRGWGTFAYMDLEELRLFLAVAQHGAFNSAADSLGVPRSTLRRRVDALEARARTPLLNRTAQGIALTEAGRVLAERGRTMLEGASALLDSIREVGEEPVGVLRVVAPVGPPRHMLLELFTGLRAAYPKLRMRSRFSDEPLGEPLTDIDVAFHFDRSPPKGPWLSEVLLEMSEGLCASKEYLARHGVPTSPEDLAGHELLVWQTPGERRDRLPLLSGGYVEVNPALVTTDGAGLRYAALRGVGLVYAPELADDPEDARYSVVPVLRDVVGGTAVLRVSVPSFLAEIPKVRVVLDWTRKYLREVGNAMPGRAR